MERTRLGRTNLAVGRTAFGALPIQRVNFDDAKRILRKAYDNGVNFFDTARLYTDSEEKIARALHDIRQNIYIATKTYAKDSQTFFKDLETSLKILRTDYIDVMQFHNIEFLPEEQASDGLYNAMLEAKKRGMIRFIGISNHKLSNAISAAESGLYDTVQYPLSHISTPDELRIVDVCRKNDVGLIAMKALAGGIITNAAASFAFLRQFDNVVPIWGIQREHELDEILGFENNPPALDEELRKIINLDRQELGGAFCRGCGYCLPCPAKIPIPMAARMSFLLRRSVHQNLLTDEWKKNMERIMECTGCNHCKDHCPYDLNTPELLKIMYDDYEKFYQDYIEPVN